MKLRALTLVHQQTGLPMTRGCTVITFRGEVGVLTDWQEPESPVYNLSKGARVYVKMPDDNEARSYFPSVIDAMFVWK